MTYIVMLAVLYIVLVGLDIFLAKRNPPKTRSLKKFTVRTVIDVAFICAIGAGLWIAVLVWGFLSEPQNFMSFRYLVIIIPWTVLWLGVTFLGMLAPMKGVWDINVDGDDITVVKAFFLKRCWKLSHISYCKVKRGGMNVYVEGRKRKAFFVDGMTDHYSNFMKRMEKEGIEIK